jgi:anti-sigma-K factor RskA
MANHERFEELIPIYALGALDGEELREVEEHLKTGCTACETMLREEENMVSLFPYSVHTPTPSPRVKRRLFERIKKKNRIAEEPYRPGFWEGLWPVWLTVGGVGALALIMFLFVSNLSLRHRINGLEIEMSRINEQTAREREIAVFLENPDVSVVNLVGLKPGLKSRGRMLWDRRQNKALFYGIDLPLVPPGKTYQLWAIADSTPISMGIFKVDESGDTVMRMESVPASVQRFAVTLEPDGGVPLPTGEMYLAGES